MKCAALLCGLLCLATVCAAQTGSISGVVRDAATSEPVARAAVSLRMLSFKALTTQADEQGQYKVDNLPPGPYRIDVSGPLERGQTLTPRQEKTVTLEPGQNLTAFDFRLPSMGIISGRVLDENKVPVPGVQVFIVDKRYDHGMLRYSLAGGRAQTDDAGAYRLTAVPSGEAFLVEARAPFPPKSTESDTPTDTLFPNVLSAESAAEIILGAGETRNGIDIQQRKLPTYCVDGTMEGAPESGLGLEFWDAVVGDSYHAQSAGTTRPGGTFHYCGIHAGQYAVAAFGAGSKPFHAAGVLEVTNHDVGDFKLLPAAMYPVSTEFVLDGDPLPNVPGPSGAIILWGQHFRLQSTFGFNGAGSVSHAAPLLPDEYTIDFHAINNGWYVKDITCGGQNVLYGTAALGGAESCGALRIVLAHDGGSLTARVADKDGNPVSEAYVAIVPESATTEAEMSAAMKVGQTGASGVYSARSLPPGKYRVLATIDTIDLAANRIDQLWAAQSRAQEVEIGANASVQVKLEPGSVTAQ